MKRKSFQNQPCPIAQAAEIFGDWWVPMILRESMYGATKFSEFQRNLGISRNILNQRLGSLVEAGVFTRELYQKPARYRYRLSEKGEAALEIVAAMANWSNCWVFTDENYPIELLDSQSGEPIKPVVVDEETGRAIDFQRLKIAPGPGFPKSEQARSWRFGKNDEANDVV